LLGSGSKVDGTAGAMRAVDYLLPYPTLLNALAYLTIDCPLSHSSLAHDWKAHLPLGIVASSLESLFVA